MPDTRPGIVFDGEWVCKPCRVAEERKSIDWGRRFKELERLCDKYRGKNVDWDFWLDKHINRDIFEKVKGKWRLKDPVYKDMDAKVRAGKE